MAQFELRTQKVHAADIIVYTLLTLGVMVMLGPFLWMILSSFKTSGEIVRVPPTFLPHRPTIDNYVDVLTGVPFVRYFLNSIFISAVGTGIVLFTSSLTGYVFAKFKFPFRNALFLILLSTLMIPFELVMTPLYLLLLQFGLINTYWALIVPYAVNVFGIYIIRQFMHQVPTDLIHAARIDGCSEFRIYTSIILPQIRPALAALGIFTFMQYWNDYLWPLVAIDSMDLRTLQVGLAMVTQSQPSTTLYDISMAGATLAVVPIIVVFLFFQRHFVEGITLTGIK